MRAKLGPNFVSGPTRRLVYAMLAEKAAAPVPPTTPQPAAAVTPETRAQQAVDHFAKLKQAQNEFSGCSLSRSYRQRLVSPGQFLNTSALSAISTSLHMSSRLGARDFVPYQMISGRFSRSSHLCRRPRSLLLPWRCDTRRRHRPVVVVLLQHRNACSHRQRPRPRPIDVPSVLMARASSPSQG